MLAFLAAAVLAQATPTATPSPTPAPSPSISVGADITLYHFHTAGVNGAGALDTSTGADRSERTELSNALLNVGAAFGRWTANAIVGDYGFPTVGAALNPDTQPGANENLYSPLPVASVAYSFDSHLSVAAGKFAALLGQESPFTYQNLNIQRGIGWEMEPTISRGVQVAYVNGAWNATLQENDAYYSGRNRAVEALVGWTPSSSTAVQFAFIVPGANVPGNATTGVGNKSEYDLMYARRIGKLQLLPYLLYVNSPASTVLGYASSEHATAAVLLGAWNFSPHMSLAFRYEAASSGSPQSDTGSNAELIGYGPGSGAQSATLTPTFRFGNGGILRFEYSYVHLTALKPGAGFAASGNEAAQNRLGFEIGVMH